MALDIPTRDQVTIITQPNQFKCRDLKVARKANELLSKGRMLVGICAVPVSQSTEIPVLLCHPQGAEKHFKENAFYIEGYPLHYFVSPVNIENYIIYELSIL